MPMETSHIWLGVFESESQLDAYFDEQYDDDDAPINRFAEEQGESYYDHDWVERSFSKHADLRHLIKGHSYSEDYIDEVIEAASTNGIGPVNTFIMADVGEFSDPKTVRSGSYMIWYIGQYKCNV